MSPAPAAGAGTPRIVFPPINVADFLALQTHFEDVSRELQLIEVGGHLGEDIPIHVSTLTEALVRGRTALRNEARRQAMDAYEAGAEEFRLELDVRDPVEVMVRATIDLLDQTDLCSERGLFLTPVAPKGARRALQIISDHLRELRLSRGNGLGPSLATDS